jgi:hypothetical protein
MFGNKNKRDPARIRAFEAAKEAARRASFLKVSRSAGSEAEKRDVALLFRICRASALAAGEAVGQSQVDVDAAISQVCDADIARLKKSSPQTVQKFGEESDKIARAYLLTVDPEALAAWTQKSTQQAQH